ncbi:MAG TPA: sulfite exporter TauE/SafE family protein [Methylophilaceae bacterium]|nr:sulfite exporter TauE/SafE family protein [Methylophilaceae bacterium]
MFISEWLLIYIVLGGVVGFLSGLLGVGGGGILVPLLATIFLYQGISSETVVHMALATSLACMIVTSASSMYAHAKRKSILWDVLVSMVPGIAIGALVTTYFAVRINADYIALFFSLFMALVALQAFLKWQPKPSSSPISLMGMLIAGLVIGSVSALAAVGGGFLSVIYLRYKNIDIKKAIGTTAGIGFPIAVTATIGYIVGETKVAEPQLYTLGYVYMPAFIGVSVASLLASPFGARYSSDLSESTLKKLFAILSLGLSVKMLISFW